MKALKIIGKILLLIVVIAVIILIAVLLFLAFYSGPEQDGSQVQELLLSSPPFPLERIEEMTRLMGGDGELKW